MDEDNEILQMAEVDDFLAIVLMMDQFYVFNDEESYRIWINTVNAQEMEHDVVYYANTIPF